MKTMKRTILPVIALLVLSTQGRAQLDLRIMLSPPMLKFFDQKSAFSANAELIMDDSSKPSVMTIKMAISGNLTRVEMDITKGTGGTFSNELVVAYRKQMITAGSAESVSVFNPDKKCIYLILPRLKVYLQTQI